MMGRLIRTVLVLLTAGVVVAACSTQQEEQGKPPLEVKKEEARDSTRLDPAPDSVRGR
jgi:ABC-type Fe3+-citrate transport system substrate-binding protein